jgi:hypothetical protein
LREAMETSRRILGDDHPDTRNSIANLGILLEMQGEDEEAETLYRLFLEMSRRALGAEHPYTVTVQERLETFLSTRGENDP